jgi:hypothetical protein
MEATSYSETLVTYLSNYTALTSYTKIIRVPWRWKQQVTPNNWWIIYQTRRRHSPEHNNESILKMKVASSSEKITPIAILHHMAEGHYVHITVLTTARHLFFFRAPCHLSLGLPSGLLPWGFPSEISWPLPVATTAVGSCVSLRNVTSSGESLQHARPKLKLHDRPLSAVRDWLFKLSLIWWRSSGLSDNPD